LLKPTRRTTPDQWGAQNRVYPPTAGRPGPRDPGLTPYTIPFGRAVAAGTHRRCVLVMFSQGGKTDTLLDIIGERMDAAPAPILYVGPTKQFLTEQFEPRVMELLDEAPLLKTKVARGKRMTKTRKVIGGVPLRLAHGGSSAALKSDPAALAITDEADEMLANVKGAGDPFGLIDYRGESYDDFVHAIVSSPSKGPLDTYVDPDSGLEFWAPVAPEDLESPIWKFWQEGTRYHWAWPCPHCRRYFIPRLSYLKWDSPKGRKVTPAEARRTAYVECPHEDCGGEGTVILEQHKQWMNANAVYVAPGQRVEMDGTVIGEPPASETLSWWASGLASPFRTFGDRAARYVEAVRSGDQDKIQTTINAGFGELFARGDGKVPEHAEVKDHSVSYCLKDVPDEVVYPVLTADIQRNRILWVIRGWGAGSTSWLIDRGTLFGETMELPVWNDLAEILATPLDGLPVKLAFIDSGFRPGKREEVPVNRVYEFCRRFARRAYPTKGSSTRMVKPLVVSPEGVVAKGKPSRFGLELIRLDTDHWKSWVHERVRWPNEQRGSWYLPEDIDEDYCRQIVSEARLKLPSGKIKWIERSKENHFLDCEAMQAAAAYFLNMQSLSDETAAARRRVRHVPADAPEPKARRNGPRVFAAADPYL
jgi:phage terminase large subunit GpA-like protein